MFGIRVAGWRSRPALVAGRTSDWRRPCHRVVGSVRGIAPDQGAHGTEWLAPIDGVRRPLMVHLRAAR